MPRQIELYHYWRSSCSWRVRWALDLKKVAHQATAVDLVAGSQRRPEYLKINPSGEVPALVVDGQVLLESLAIIEWLEEAYPTPALLPQDSIGRAKVRELALTIACGIQPLQNLKVLQYLSQDSTARIRHAHYWIDAGFKALEAKLYATAGSFCYGGLTTMADLFLVPQTYNARRYGVDLTKYPTIKAISDRCLKLPECERAAPHNQPGAVP